MKKLLFALLVTIFVSNKVQSQYKNNINVNGNIYFLGLQYERSINRMFSTSLTLGFPKSYFRSSKNYLNGDLHLIQKYRGINHKLEFNYFPLAKENNYMKGFNIGLTWLSLFNRHKYIFYPEKEKVTKKFRYETIFGLRAGYQWLFKSRINISLNADYGRYVLINYSWNNKDFYKTYGLSLEASFGYSF